MKLIAYSDASVCFGLSKNPKIAGGTYQPTEVISNAIGVSILDVDFREVAVISRLHPTKLFPNELEMIAAAEALYLCQKLGATEVELCSDSESVCLFRLRTKALEQAMAVFESCKVIQIPRDSNKRADQLAGLPNKHIQANVRSQIKRMNMRIMNRGNRF